MRQRPPPSPPFKRMDAFTKPFRASSAGITTALGSTFAPWPDDGMCVHYKYGCTYEERETLVPQSSIDV